VGALGVPVMAGVGTIVTVSFGEAVRVAAGTVSDSSRFACAADVESDVALARLAIAKISNRRQRVTSESTSDSFVMRTGGMWERE
jgi:hypothetical protein